MSDPTVRLLGLSGSLRSASHHRGLLRAARSLVPADTTVEIFDLRDIPPFDEDVTDLAESVVALKARIEAADGVILASPEHNHSVSGVLKNAIDWASRPAFASPFTHKRCGIISASPSATGGARGQQHLKTILLSMISEVYPSRDLVFGHSSALFDDAGDLRDEEALARLRSWLDGFVAWLR